MTPYDAALEAFRSAAAVHRAVTLDYRARRIGDADFLASRQRQAAASAALDVAEREAQAALPGAETVRETERPTPQFETPFTLDAETDTTPRGRQGSLFE